MSHYFEIETFGMVADGTGGFITAEAVDKEPEFFDVMVTKRWPDDHPNWARVDVVEEHENLTAEQAADVEDKLFAKYPNAVY